MTTLCRAGAADAGRMAVRWYVLVLPAGHRGSRTRSLDEELERRKRRGESAFEYFAPTFVDRSAHRTGGTRRPLYFNYVFVRASELEIMRIKQRVPIFNFLRRVADSEGGHFPYLTDEAMDNLRLVANAYSGLLPAYTPDAGMLRKGDRVRICGGRFDGVEATLLRRPSGPGEELAVCVDDWFWVPVMHIAPGHYEIIELKAENKSLYSMLDNERTIAELRAALLASLSADGASESQRRLACETALRYGQLRPTTRAMRGKHLAVMLQAYAVAGDRLRLESTVSDAERLLREPCPELSRALLLTSLYGATRRHRNEAIGATAAWRCEDSPKKNKRDIMAWLDAMDNILNQSN